MAVTLPASVRVLLPNGQVEEVKFETYLAGAVAAEIGVNVPLEALKAQAVASRTYVVSAQRHQEHNADVCTTAHCQKWKRVDPVSAPEVFRAVSETWAMIAIYEGKPINAFFFEHCDGHTRNAEDMLMPSLPYLRGVDCPCGFLAMKGHGVGMCKRGAIVMARRGASFEQILQHYYRGVVVIHAAREDKIISEQKENQPVTPPPILADAKPKLRIRKKNEPVKSERRQSKSDRDKAALRPPVTPPETRAPAAPRGEPEPALKRTAPRGAPEPASKRVAPRAPATPPETRAPAAPRAAPEPASKRVAPRVPATPPETRTPHPPRVEPEPPSVLKRIAPRVEPEPEAAHPPLLKRITLPPSEPTSNQVEPPVEIVAPTPIVVEPPAKRVEINPVAPVAAIPVEPVAKEPEPQIIAPAPTLSEPAAPPISESPVAREPVVEPPTPRVPFDFPVSAPAQQVAQASEPAQESPAPPRVQLDFPVSAPAPRVAQTNEPAQEPPAPPRVQLDFPVSAPAPQVAQASEPAQESPAPPRVQLDFPVSAPAPQVAPTSEPAQESPASPSVPTPQANEPVEEPSVPPRVELDYPVIMPVAQFNAAAAAEQAAAAKPPAAKEASAVTPRATPAPVSAQETSSVIARRVHVDYLPGEKMIAGSLPRGGIHLTIQDPHGNKFLIVSGTAPDYGVGGFEFIVEENGLYIVTLGGRLIEVDVHDGETAFIHADTVF